MMAIQTAGLRKTYGDTVAVAGLDLTVAPGELFALLGVNGAGKSTTVRLLSCLTRPSGGEAWLLGKSICTDAAAVKELIAVCPQENALAPGLTTRENLAMMCGIFGLSARRRQETMDQLRQALGLAAVWTRRAGTLSGGWQRRLSIAMALVGQPQILFLDEPTLGLDVLARQELWALIRSLKGRVTIVLTTHAMDEAEALADRVGILRDGVLLVCDTVAGLCARTGAERLEQAFVRVIQTNGQEATP